jgi:hypothetical protein
MKALQEELGPALEQVRQGGRAVQAGEDVVLLDLDGRQLAALATAFSVLRQGWSG